MEGREKVRSTLEWPDSKRLDLGKPEIKQASVLSIAELRSKHMVPSKITGIPGKHKEKWLENKTKQ